MTTSRAGQMPDKSDSDETSAKDPGEKGSKKQSGNVTHGFDAFSDAVSEDTGTKDPGEKGSKKQFGNVTRGFEAFLDAISEETGTKDLGEKGSKKSSGKVTHGFDAFLDAVSDETNAEDPGERGSMKQSGKVTHGFQPISDAISDETNAEDPGEKGSMKQSGKVTHGFQPISDAVSAEKEEPELPASMNEWDGEHDDVDTGAKPLKPFMFPVDLSSPDKFVMDQRIHILGIGNVGKFVAYALKSNLDPPPITLIMHKWSNLEEFIRSGRTISIHTGEQHTAGPFDVEVAAAIPILGGDGLHVEHSSSAEGNTTGDESTESDDIVDDKNSAGDYTSDQGDESPPQPPTTSPYRRNDPINHLIVCLKTPTTVAALNGLKHRLNRHSTICFLQNGSGLIEELNEKVFQDRETRPNYIKGVITHGLYYISMFATNYSGRGMITLGMVLREPDRTGMNSGNPINLYDFERDLSKPSEPGAQGTSKPLESIYGPTALYLLRTLCWTPDLVATPVSPLDIRLIELEKLATNCLINPITSLLDCRNGELQYNFALSKVYYLLLIEISLVILKLPELQGVPGLERRFSPKRLALVTNSIARKTGLNISSMLQDMRRGRETEVEYINGYIVQKGEELGVRPVMNYLIMQLILGKQAVISRETDSYTPYRL